LADNAGGLVLILGGDFWPQDFQRCAPVEPFKIELSFEQALRVLSFPEG
jgi:hypothetical protein